MRKLAAIFLLGIFLFNWVGYQLFYDVAQRQISVRFEDQLDQNNYDHSQLLSIRISATSLPYVSSSKDFERVNGQLEIEGILYQYVEKRIFNDSLELLCIPNQPAMKLTAAKYNFFKLVNDLQPGNQGKKSGDHQHLSKQFSAEYFSFEDGYALNHPGCTANFTSHYFKLYIPEVFPSVSGQPPELS